MPGSVEFFRPLVIYFDVGDRGIDYAEGEIGNLLRRTTNVSKIIIVGSIILSNYNLFYYV